MDDRRCITFAGAVGSSKSPIANYLSTTLCLPVLNNDLIRVEVTEDLRAFDVDAYEQRQNDRCRNMLATGRSFIYDASVDRKWPQLSDWLNEWQYRCFIISLDLTKAFLTELYDAKGYTELNALDSYIRQHETFLAEHGDLIGLHITDASFQNRLDLAREYIGSWTTSNRVSKPL